MAPQPFNPGSAPGVRVHAEHSAHGLKLWLGIDGTPAQVSAQAAALLAELRRDGALQGQRIASVVCNGAVLYAPARPPISRQQE